MPELELCYCRFVIVQLVLRPGAVLRVCPGDICTPGAELCVCLFMLLPGGHEALS